jgi:hypothetical protein
MVRWTEMPAIFGTGDLSRSNETKVDGDVCKFIYTEFGSVMSQEVVNPAQFFPPAPASSIGVCNPVYKMSPRPFRLNRQTLGLEGSGQFSKIMQPEKPRFFMRLTNPFMPEGSCPAGPVKRGRWLSSSP